MTSNCLKKRDTEIAKKVNEIGVDYFCFNNRGHDVISYYSIQTGKGKKKQMGGTAFEDPEEGYYDIIGAINKMRDMGYKHIYLQGHSLGATKVVLTYNRLLKEKRRDILDSISGVILLSLIDILSAQKVFLGDRFNEILDLAEKMENEGRQFELMPNDVFIHLITAKTYLKYFKNYEGLYYPQYSNEMWKADELNNIKVPLFMRWGNKNELIVQKADELVEFVSDKIKNNKKDIGYIDGASHNYSHKLEELSTQIASFIKNID